MLKKFTNKRDVTLLQLFKTALNHHLALIEQGQPVRDCLRAVQIVRHYDGRHMMLLLELENQIVDFPGADGIEAGGGLIQQQNIRLQSERAG